MRLYCKFCAVCLVFFMLVLANSPVFAAAKTPVKQESIPSNIVKTAEKYLKTPYRFGGESPAGFDCSGFVKYVYDRHGKKLPRTTDVQYKTGKKVARAGLKTGDLVFFATYASGASHVGIYTGNGKFIHASSSRGVMISQLNETYWKPRYLGARRIIN
ncbi:MAG: pgdS 3 [Sporomusa sp.]|nr:pgdS 3 [Sporomusa sp.]